MIDSLIHLNYPSPNLATKTSFCTIVALCRSKAAAANKEIDILLPPTIIQGHDSKYFDQKKVKRSF